MITSIGENGSHVPYASRLLHHTDYLSPLFWRWGIKQKKLDFICRCSVLFTVFTENKLAVFIQLKLHYSTSEFEWF